MIYKNRHLFTSQEFEIQKSSLKVDIKNLFDAIEYEISFEHIDNRKKIQTSINHGLLIISVFLFLIGILLFAGSNDELKVIFIFGAVVFAIFAFISRKRSVTITSHDGNKIELYFNKGNKQEVVNFANNIIEASDKYLRNKYSKIDPALPIESQLNNIQFLRNREVITEEDYEALKNQLLGRKSKSSISFGYS